jgi:hypothetical protein
LRCEWLLLWLCYGGLFGCLGAGCGFGGFRGGCRLAVWLRAEFAMEMTALNLPGSGAGAAVAGAGAALLSSLLLLGAGGGSSGGVGWRQRLSKRSGSKFIV